MYINASFDFAAGATQTDISQFQNAVNIAINYFESVFTDLNVTLNVKFAYGEQYAGNPGGTLITYTPMANATSTGTFLLGTNQTAWDKYDYTTVRNQLLTMRDSLQWSAYSTLPAASPFGNDTLWVSSAQEKALGLTPAIILPARPQRSSAALTGSSAKSATKSSQQEVILRIGPSPRPQTANSTT